MLLRTIPRTRVFLTNDAANVTIWHAFRFSEFSVRRLIKIADGTCLSS